MNKIYLKVIIFYLLLTLNCFGAEEGMPQLNPEYWVSQIFWVILIFGSLYVVLWRKILPKINDNLENRKSQILKDLDDAQKFKDQSEKKLLEYNKILEQAQQESKKILENTRKKITRDVESKKNKLSDEIEKEIKKAEIEINKLKLSSISDINKIAIDTSSEIIKKILNTNVNSSSVSAIVNDVSKKEIGKHL